MNQQPASKRPRYDPPTVSSNEALQFEVCSYSATGADQAQVARQFAPEFSHQTFGQDEEIKGYEGLKVQVLLDSNTYHACVQLSYTSKFPGADDVLHKLQSEFPAGLFQNKAAWLEQISAVSSLASDLQALPVLKRDGPTAVREVAISSASPAIQDLHARLQPLLYFFVDGASLIDHTDPSWTLLLATQITDGGQETVVGFTTVYAFYAYPDRVRLRISQVLVLPPFQRKGIGRLLLRAAYELADQRQALDVTFEDPTDQVQRLRQEVELARGLACPWLVAQASGALGLVASQHVHTHSRAHANGSTPAANGHTNGHASHGHANGHSSVEADQAEAAMAGSLALSSEHARQACRELRITIQQVEPLPGQDINTFCSEIARVWLVWEGLLARQPCFQDGPGRAALRALIERRLGGKTASTRVSAARKRVLDTGEGRFIMWRVGCPGPEAGLAGTHQTPADADAGQAPSADEEEAEEDLNAAVAARLRSLYRAAGLVSS